MPFAPGELRPLQRVLLMARYLRANGEVRLAGTSSQDPLDLGLRLIGAERMSGTPFQYTAVTALAASRLGVPARVVVGAAPGVRGIVEQRDVLSWVELQLADGTWRILEPDRYTGVHAPSDDESEDERLGAGDGSSPSSTSTRTRSRSRRAPTSSSHPTSSSRTSRTPGPWSAWWPSLSLHCSSSRWLPCPS